MEKRELEMWSIRERFILNFCELGLIWSEGRDMWITNSLAEWLLNWMLPFMEDFSFVAVTFSMSSLSPLKTWTVDGFPKGPKLGLRPLSNMDGINTFDDCSLSSWNILLRMMTWEFYDVSKLGPLEVNEDGCTDVAFYYDLISWYLKLLVRTARYLYSKISSPNYEIFLRFSFFFKLLFLFTELKKTSLPLISM